MSAPGRSQALTPERHRRDGCQVPAPGRSQALAPERPERPAAGGLARPVRLFIAAHAVAVLGVGAAALLIGHGLEMPPVPAKPHRMAAPPAHPATPAPQAAPDWTQRPDVAAPWSRP